MRRIERVNSLIKEVISEVIRKDVKNPHIDELTTVSRVEVSKDLRHGKVYISIIGDDEKRKEGIAALNSAAGFIAVRASKKVVMRYFPELRFLLDDSVDKHMRIEELLSEIKENDSKSDSHES